MKIALVGNCQVVGMGEAFRTLFPKATVNAYHVREPSPHVDEITASLPGFDLVVSQILPSHGLPSLTIDRLREMKIARLEMFPPFVFRGFHPDSFLMIDQGRPMQSPIETFNSQILAAAFLLGLPIQRAVTLFNQFVYAKLGYEAGFHCARQALVDELDSYGYGSVVADSWDGWLAEGAFMHTPKHPKVRVIASLATAAARRSGLLGDDAVLPVKPLPDVFDQQHAWPVYPGYAERIGVPGDMVFRAYRRAVANEADRYLDLQAFAQRSYEIFESVGRERIALNAAVSQTRDVLSSVVRT